MLGGTLIHVIQSIWHRRVAQFHVDHLNKLACKDLVISLSKNVSCDECKNAKQVNTPFKYKNIVATNKPLQLLHMDIFGPSRTMGFCGN